MVKHVELVNNEGRVLRGYLDMPECWNRSIVIMFHGFTGNKTEHAGHFRNFSRVLSKEGIASLRLDFTGNGESDGEFSDFTFDNLMSDANLILDYAKKLDGVLKVYALGFSMGGAVAGMLASRRPEDLDKLLLWSPAGNILDIIKRYFDKGIKLENNNALHGIFEISTDMIASLDKYDPFDNLGNYKNKVYIIHGSKDQAVNSLYSMRYAASFANSNVHIIQNAGHGYDLLSEREELYSKSLNFLK